MTVENPAISCCLLVKPLRDARLLLGMVVWQSRHQDVWSA